MQQSDMPHRNKKPISWAKHRPRSVAVKKTFLTLTAVVAISMAGGAAGFAAELPTYELNGFPISPVQVGLLGAANVREQSPAVTAAASPHQLSVLTPRPKLKAASAAQNPTETSGLAAH
jgi:hypothetical protein